MGTSNQMNIGSPDRKRVTSLHKDGKPDPVIVYHSDWKSKRQVDPSFSPPRMQSNHERIFVPASNVDRKKEEGCMAKIKIERTAKLE